MDRLQWTGDNIDEVFQFVAPLEPVPIKGFTNSDDIFGLETIKGFVVVRKGQLLLKSEQGIEVTNV